VAEKPEFTPIGSMARIVASGNDADAIGSKLERAGDIERFYGPGYKRPTLLQALKDAGIDEAETVAEMSDTSVACRTERCIAGDTAECG